MRKYLKDFFQRTFDVEGDYIAQYIIPKNKEELKILVNKNETNLRDVYIPKNITDPSELYLSLEASLREQENSQKKVFDKNKIVINKPKDGCIIPKNKEELEMLVNKLETNLADIVIPENITDLSKLFYKSNRADFSGLEAWDVAHIENMSLMFCGCRNFTGKEIEEWDIRSVKDFSGTFKECKNFNPDLSSWQINAKNFDDMFSLCENFTGKGLEHWEIAKMQDMSNMFFGCKNFTGKSLEFWDTKFVKIMNGAFYGCQKFNADLSQWKLDSLRKAIYVFGDTDIRSIPNNFLEKFKELPAIEVGEVGMNIPERYYGID